MGPPGSQEGPCVTKDCYEFHHLELTRNRQLKIVAWGITGDPLTVLQPLIETDRERLTRLLAEFTIRLVQ